MSQGDLADFPERQSHELHAILVDLYMFIGDSEDSLLELLNPVDFETRDKVSPESPRVISFL
jgi:hypothetical protein